jgi:hypothetical protein
MRSWVRRHRWLNGLLAVVLLLGQTMAMAYDCQRLDPRLAAGRGPDQAPTVAMPGCAQHAGPDSAADPASTHPLLCKAHCQADQQSVNTGPVGADVPASDLLGAVLWHLPEPWSASCSRAAMPAPRGAGPPAGFPPLYLSLLVLRN